VAKESRKTLLARGLSSGRTNVVALLVPDITKPFYFDIIRGRQRQLAGTAPLDPDGLS
jgi:DNA-binding LacI/PurR family transcriptional regulator